MGIELAPRGRARGEPEASAWRLLEARARDRLLVHALDALDALHQPGAGARCPADLADMLAAMVDAGVLDPVRLCLAHPLARSIMAFRGIGPSAGGRPSSTWTRTDAHLWTYAPVSEEERFRRALL